MLQPQFVDSGAQLVVVAVVVSFLLSLLLVATARAHGTITMDPPGAVQKSHRKPTPRVGGLAVYSGLAFAWWLDPHTSLDSILATILVAGIPAFLFGVLEDLTKRVGVLARLLATMASGVLAWVISDVALTRVGMPILDSLLAFAPVAVLFTAFAVGGLANAVNIIDGFNGLASGTVIIALMALATIAYIVGDKSLALACFVVAASVGGFWVLNFPYGKIFLGDGGAYFVGFALAWLAIALPMRNPTVSPWASLLVCAYPVVEMLYSMVRRAWQRQSLTEPDSAHLHSLIATQIVQPGTPALPLTLQNAAVSALMWVPVALTAALAIALHKQPGLLVASVLAYAVAYHVCYWKIVSASGLCASDFLDSRRAAGAVPSEFQS